MDAPLTVSSSRPRRLTGRLAPAVMLASVLVAVAPAAHAGDPPEPGTPVAWGFNGARALGDGTTTDRHTPVQVAGVSGVTALAGGMYHSLALLDDGSVRAWGSNSDGQLGDGTTNHRTTPVAVAGLSEVTAIAAGARHSLALLEDGTVRVWGNNFSGQLGDGTSDSRPTPLPVAGLSGVTAIAAGAFHSLALLEDGSVRAWGSNGSGALGDGTTTLRLRPVQVAGLSGVTAIAGGIYHSLALLEDGNMRSWGRNHVGQLGDGTTTNRHTPVSVAGLSGVTAIAAGDNHSLALLEAGTVRAWGFNHVGQLGDGTTTTRFTPVEAAGLSGVTAIAAGGLHNLALLEDGSVRAWGHNNDGQLGDGSTTTRFTPVAVDGLAGMTAIAAGRYHSLAVEVEAAAAPTITVLEAPADPIGVGTAVQVSAFFTDPNANDAHTCTIEWGDGSTTVIDPATEPATEPATDPATDACAAEHAYPTADVYTVTVTVTDDGGLSDTRAHEYVVVYDPAGGFVTGGGWIDSPAGAYALNPGASGIARFGSVSRYRQGASIPEGNTRFEFRAGDLDFRSTAYEWLVVSGPKAQFKGSGRVNGLDGFGFLLTANDGALPGGGGLDRFRIKIWDTITGSVVYDNQAGADDTTPASTELGGGAIVIHTK